MPAGEVNPAGIAKGEPMYAVQCYIPGRGWQNRFKRHYAGDAVDRAAAFARAKVPARIRTYSPRQGRYVTVWEHDPFESAHPRESWEHE